MFHKYTSQFVCTVHVTRLNVVIVGIHAHAPVEQCSLWNDVAGTQGRHILFTAHESGYIVGPLLTAYDAG